jgi:anthranilate/para-aminobenzoate synthase component I
VPWPSDGPGGKTAAFVEDAFSVPAATRQSLRGRIVPPAAGTEFTEEQRSKRPSIFSVLRAMIAAMTSCPGPQGSTEADASDEAAPPSKKRARDAEAAGGSSSSSSSSSAQGAAGGELHDDLLGLYGSFSYDLCFQFEDVPLSQRREGDLRDAVLFLPDVVIRVDHGMDGASMRTYEFDYGDLTSRGMPRDSVACPYRQATGESGDTDQVYVIGCKGGVEFVWCAIV